MNVVFQISIMASISWPLRFFAVHIHSLISYALNFGEFGFFLNYNTTLIMHLLCYEHAIS
jgi:hypothetical protein